MSERETTLRTAVIAYFPMFIATLSLVTSIFNGYLNAKFVDIIQRNVGRGEYMRTCKEIIDAYFQVKTKAMLIRERTADAGVSGLSPEQAEAVAAVSRFAALGTYLANLREDGVRERYSALSQQLEQIVREAGQASGDPAKLFEPADRMFAEMNDDCIRSAKAAPI
jgi:hypothetical protein